MERTRRGIRSPLPDLGGCACSVDASTLRVGDHDVALRVSDAAGNVPTVYAARKTIVAPGRT